MTRAIARGQITFSEQLLIQEKEEIRSDWYAINGTNLSDTVGETGSYYLTKLLAAKYSSRTGRAIFTFNGITYTFSDGQGGAVLYNYPGVGTSQLDTAYIALREFLRGQGLFDEGDSFPNVFDWNTYSTLLAVYYAGERAVLEAVEDSQDMNIDNLVKWGEDGVISPVEKKSLAAVYEQEGQEYSRIAAEAVRYLSILPPASQAYSTLSTAHSTFVTAWADSVNERGAYYAFEAILSDLEASSDRTESHYDDIIDYFTAKATLVAAIDASVRYTIDEKAKLSDVEYLRRALPQDTTTQVENAMVLSTLLGVKDGDNVVAGLAGGLEGFPMLWAAAQSIQEVNEALWRVYGDGEQILGVHNGKRIRIYPDANSASPDPRIEIYDGVDNDAPSSVFSGRTFTSISDIFGNAGSAVLSDNLCSFSESNLDTSDPTNNSHLVSAGGRTYYREMQYATFVTEKAGKVSLSGNITLDGTFITDDECRLNMCNITALLDGQSIGGLDISDGDNQTYWSGTLDVTPHTLYLPAGTHQLVLRFRFSMPLQPGPLFGYSAGVRHASTAVSIEYNTKRNELFGNGLAIGQTNLQYLWAANEGSYFRFKAVAGNAGIQIYNGQLKVKLGGSWYLVGVSGSSITLTPTSE